MGSPQTASATARDRAGLDTVIPAGKAKCRWFCGRALTRLTTSRVTAAGSAHRAALPAVPPLPGLAPPPPARLVPGGLAGCVALDVVAAWLPQAATRAAVPAAARTGSTGRGSAGRVRRPDRVPDTPMVFSVRRYAEAVCPPGGRTQVVRRPGTQCVQGTERRPGPLSTLNYNPWTSERRQRFRSVRTRHDQWHDSSHQGPAKPVTRPPGCPPTRPDQRKPARSDAGRLHPPQLVLQFPDLVPDPGRYLELQLRRGRVHLVGQLGDQRDQVAPGGAAALCFARAAGRGPHPRRQ